MVVRNEFMFEDDDIGEEVGMGGAATNGDGCGKGRVWAARAARQEFVNVRGRPAVFLFTAGEVLGPEHVVRLREVLGSRQFDELDLVIDSEGGNIHVAYQVVELLRRRTRKLYACVPRFAMSAATLLCLGADQIVLDEIAHLGPLDAQWYEEGKGGEGDFFSALSPIRALDHLRQFSLQTLDEAVDLIARRSGMGLDDCLQHGVGLVGVTTGPLFQRVDAQKLGAYLRGLAVAYEYGERLLARYSRLDPGRRSAALGRLVYGYPAHDFVIDGHELREMGFDVQHFSDEEQPVVQRLCNTIDPDWVAVTCMLPGAPADGAGAGPDTQAF